MEQEFPTTVYVVREDDGAGNTYLSIYENIDEVSPNDIVGVYTYQKTGRIEQTRTLVSR